MRILLAGVLGTGLATLLLAPVPTAFLLALQIMLIAFLLGAAKLAIDLIELIRADLIADATLLVTLGVAFTIFTGGDRLLLGTLLALALATQVVPLVTARRAGLRDAES